MIYVQHLSSPYMALYKFDYYYYYPREEGYVFISVCLLVSRIAQKPFNRFSRNLIERLHYESRTNERCNLSFGTHGFRTAAIPSGIVSQLTSVLVNFLNIPSAFKITALSVQLPHCLSIHLSAFDSVRPWRYINLLTYLCAWTSAGLRPHGPWRTGEIRGPGPIL